MNKNDMLLQFFISLYNGHPTTEDIENFAHLMDIPIESIYNTIQNYKEYADGLNIKSEDYVKLCNHKDVNDKEVCSNFEGFNKTIADLMAITTKQNRLIYHYIFLNRIIKNRIDFDHKHGNTISVDASRAEQYESLMEAVNRKNETIEILAKESEELLKQLKWFESPKNENSAVNISFEDSFDNNEVQNKVDKLYSSDIDSLLENISKDTTPEEYIKKLQYTSLQKDILIQGLAEMVRNKNL